MDDEMWSQEFLIARDHLLRVCAALELVQGSGHKAEVALREMRDEAKAEVVRLMPSDYREDLVLQRAQHGMEDQGDPETSAFRDAAIVIGVATAAAIAIAPVAAMAVNELVIKELTKAVVSGVFVGVATVAAEGALARHNRNATAAKQTEERATKRKRRTRVSDLGPNPSPHRNESQDQNEGGQDLSTGMNDSPTATDNRLDTPDEARRQDDQDDQDGGLAPGR
jgi:hypothetical protein